MSEEANVSDVKSIEAVIARYGAAVDHGWAREAAGSIFAPDACFELRDGRRVTGIAAIVDFLEATPPGTHVVGVPSIDVSGDQARSTAAFIYRSATDTLAAGYYHDVLVQTDDGWRIVHRAVCAAGRETCPFDQVESRER
jgi:hypothetical protein